MTMPWTYGALQPADKRYTDLRFRRVARFFDGTRLDYGDAAELAAFVRTVDGVKHAKSIFGWHNGAHKYVQKFMDHMDQFPDAARMEAENRSCVTRDDGLKCLRAMQDGGWTKGSVPGIVRLALLDMRDAGMSQPAIARELGLTHDQVRVMANGLRRRAACAGLAGLWAV